MLIITMSPSEITGHEPHHLLPSGPWEGFYNHANDAGKHAKALTIKFLNGRIDGSGTDDVGAFSWTGVYDLVVMRCTVFKTYNSHRVIYHGHIDENGIWGNWEIPPFDKGGFHIWPKFNATEEFAALQEHIAESTVAGG